MREDMFKVIVERPRGGRGRANSSRKRLNKDGDLPTKIGISRHMSITNAKSKWLSENLAPLRRYLGKQVGRPWNDVHSDILATIKSRDPVQQHILQHIDGYVARYITLDRDGNWINPRGYFRSASPHLWHQRYYVDPIDGHLKDSVEYWKRHGIDPKPWRRKPAKPDPNKRVLDDMHEIRRIDGIWYEIGYAVEPDALRWDFDLVERALVPASQRRAVSKRQLARNELLAQGIANYHN
jgi:hypothetical protein